MALGTEAARVSEGCWVKAVSQKAKSYESAIRVEARNKNVRAEITWPIPIRSRGLVGTRSGSTGRDIETPAPESCYEVAHYILSSLDKSQNEVDMTSSLQVSLKNEFQSRS